MRGSAHDARRARSTRILQGQLTLLESAQIVWHVGQTVLCAEQLPISVMHVDLKSHHFPDRSPIPQRKQARNMVDELAG